MKRKEIVVTVDNEVYDWIKQSADFNRLSLSETVEEMLNEIVAEHKGEK